MPRLSQTLSFLQSPSFRQAQSALIGLLTQCILIGRTPQARVRNVTPLSIITSFSFQVSFISSSPKRERSRVTDTVKKYVFANKLQLRQFLTGCTIHCDVTLFPSLTHSLTHTHTHSLTHSLTHTHTHSLTHSHTHVTRYTQNSAFEQSIANT